MHDAGRNDGERNDAERWGARGAEAGMVRAQLEEDGNAGAGRDDGTEVRGDERGGGRGERTVPEEGGDGGDLPGLGVAGDDGCGGWVVDAVHGGGGADGEQVREERGEYFFWGKGDSKKERGKAYSAKQKESQAKTGAMALGP